MVAVRRDHLIPRFYLEGFATAAPGRRNPALHVFDRARGKTYLRTPERVWREANYYDVEGPDGQPTGSTWPGEDIRNARRLSRASPPHHHDATASTLSLPTECRPGILPGVTAVTLAVEITPVYVGLVCGKFSTDHPASRCNRTICAVDSAVVPRWRYAAVQLPKLTLPSGPSPDTRHRTCRTHRSRAT